jgi:hypothetical protein
MMLGASSVSGSPTNFETLDLRFRVPTKSAGAWLPGGVWIWFLLGTAVGVGGWLYGRNILLGRLVKQVSTNDSPSKSLFALEALESLNPDTLEHLVAGLLNADPRVTRSAYQKINLHMDQWVNADPTMQYSAMKSLALNLQQVPQSSTDNSLTLVRSLAARLYSTTVSIDDPQVKQVTQICERLLALPDKTKVAEKESNFSPIPQSPPAPLERLTEPPKIPTETPINSTTRSLSDSTYSTDSTDPIHRSSSTPSASLHLVARPTRPRRSDTVKPSSSEEEDGSISFSDSDEPTTTMSLSDRTVPQSSLNAVPTSSNRQINLPVVVATPASTSNQPVAKLRTVSIQPDLAGIEKLEIAELIRLLANDNADVAKAAALALRHKGMTDQKINLASELAMGSAARRLELIQQISTATDLDPRPWLIWMGEDGEPEVRKMSIALLIPMADENVYRSLRNLAARESDAGIKDMIMRTLLSASK